MTDQPDLREEIARLLYVEFEGREPVNEPRGHWLFAADRILAIPRIANALKLTVVKTMGEGDAL